MMQFTNANITEMKRKKLNAAENVFSCIKPSVDLRLTDVLVKHDAMPQFQHDYISLMSLFVLTN